MLKFIPILVVILLVVFLGPQIFRTKSDPDGEKRVNAVLRENLTRQAQLNREILRQNHEVAAAARKLVEADAEARREVIALQREIQAERNSIVKLQDAMNAERRELARERIRDPIVAAALINAAFLGAVAMALVFYWFLLRRLGMDNDEATLRDVLLAEITSDRPVFLPRQASPPALPHEPTMSLPGE
jgi:hypothetical protein